MADHFPQTLTPTWWDKQLADGDRGRREINAHMFEVYRAPLSIYFRGHPYRHFIEPDEAVNGFLASRLERADFFDKWRGSGKRLRHWLMISFRHYLLEDGHRRQRDGRAGALPDVAIEGDDPTPEQETDRAFKIAMVRGALADTEAWCHERGLGAHWLIFIGHWSDRRSFADLGARFGVAARRASVMSRTAQSRFKSFIVNYLERDGIAPGEVDSEIRAMLD